MPKPPPKQIVAKIRADLEAPLLSVCASLHQNPNNFINLCVEGCLRAIQNPEQEAAIPIVELGRKLARIERQEQSAVSRLADRMLLKFGIKSPPDNLDQFKSVLMRLVEQYHGPASDKALKQLWDTAVMIHVQNMDVIRRVAITQG
jgi:hypothetical protein